MDVQHRHGSLPDFLYPAIFAEVTVFKLDLLSPPSPLIAQTPRDAVVSYGGGDVHLEKMAATPPLPPALAQQKGANLRRAAFRRFVESWSSGGTIGTLDRTVAVGRCGDSSR